MRQWRMHAGSVALLPEGKTGRTAGAFFDFFSDSRKAEPADGMSVRRAGFLAVPLLPYAGCFATPFPQEVIA
ncbi:hypothetical protein JOC69_000616 [Heliobacterium gestii]|nr:hypothetical protein [Heliomicrobium gestii]